MALIPVKAFSGVLPIIFLEARVSGDTHQLVTQMGVSIDADQCSIGMLTRTSGVLLIAGFGSYCAYRIANKFLEYGFVWTIFDAAHCDMLARADSKLLHPQPCCSNEDDRRTIVSVDEFDDGTENQRTPTSSIRNKAIRISGPNGNYIKVLENLKLNSKTDLDRNRGLAGLNSTPIKNQVKRRSEVFDDISSVDGSSSISAASKLRKIGRNEKIRIEKEDFDDDEISVAPTEASEIRLLWDSDTFWDDEFAVPGTSHEMDENQHFQPQRCKSPTSSDISEMSAFKTLQAMFDAANEPGPSTSAEIDHEGSVFGDASDLAQIIHSKCVRSSNYMYHSVIVASSDIDGSDVISICSGRSVKSNLSAIKEKHSRRSHGLWELASRPPLEKPSTSNYLDTPNQISNSMTDSGISKSSTGSSSQKSNQMVDSTIDTGFVSSDDDGISIRSGKATKSVGISRKANLMDDIKEQPSPIKRIQNSDRNRLNSNHSRNSVKSLEWFDE